MKGFLTFLRVTGPSVNWLYLESISSVTTGMNYEPSERYYHSTHIIGDYMYMWGGDRPGLPKVHNSHLKHQLSSTVDLLHLNTGRWEQRRTTGEPPLGVKGYASVVMDRNIMFFGGSCNHDDCRHNSMYSLHVNEFSWTELFHTNYNYGPMTKAYSNMIGVHFEEERGERDYLLVICGLGPCGGTLYQTGAEYSNKGLSGFVRTNEHHYFNLNNGQWISPTVTGRCQPRYMSTLTSLSQTSALLFGGNTPNGISNTVYIGNFTKMSIVWYKLVPNYSLSSLWPCARYGHASVLIKGTPFMLVVGGADTNDAWLLDISNRTWTEVTSLFDSVTNRYDHSLSVWSVTSNVHWIIEFGGLQNSFIISQPMIIETIYSNGKLTIEDSFQLNDTSKYQQKLSLRRGGTRETTMNQQRFKLRSLSLPTSTITFQSSEVSLPSSPFSRVTRQYTVPHYEVIDTVLEREEEKRQEESKLQALVSNLQEELSRCLQEKSIICTKLEHEVKEKERLKEEVTENEKLRQKISEYEGQLRALHLEVLSREERERNLVEILRETKSANRLESGSLKDEKVHENNDITSTTNTSWLVESEEVMMTSKVLGKGGWGQVNVAIFRGLKVAAKTLHEIILSDYNISVFKHEMEMASRIRHPNLVQFIGAIQEDVPVILSELMPTSLRKELETRTALGYHTVLNISLDIACALNYLHLFKPHPILHRDVSSANVLLQAMGGAWRAKLSDYGSANLQNLISQTISPGNPLYAPPEAANPLHHSPAMDIYSYGVLFLEMTSQRLPQPSEREIHLLNVTDTSLRCLISECLNDNPRLRPTMGDLINELEDKIDNLK